jgi:dihydroxyacetone kinase-like protein
MELTMPSVFGPDELRQMIRGAIAAIKSQVDELSRLDAATGDGDHGTAIGRAMIAAGKALDENPGQGMSATMKAIGWGVMGIDGGSTGPLFGSFFMGLSKATKETESLDAAGLATAFEQGFAALQKQSKAAVGDKTLIDAFHPAVTAMRDAADRGAEIPAIFVAAAEAADRGAKSTVEMQAKFGRARNLGERSIGHIDPGAASAALLFRGFADGLNGTR